MSSGRHRGCSPFSFITLRAAVHGGDHLRRKLNTMDYHCVLKVYWIGPRQQPWAEVQQPGADWKGRPLHSAGATPYSRGGREVATPTPPPATPSATGSSRDRAPATREGAQPRGGPALQLLCVAMLLLAALRGFGGDGTVRTGTFNSA